MRIDCGACVVRDWTRDDKASLIRFANNRKVWRNLKDRFPHPYREEHADGWFAFLAGTPEPSHWAIEADGQAVGLAHLRLQRLEAPVFEWNAPSMRVLEKCGFVRERVLAKSIRKDGELIDQVLYTRVS